jgi:hypothetical protein
MFADVALLTVVVPEQSPTINCPKFAEPCTVIVCNKQGADVAVAQAVPELTKKLTYCLTVSNAPLANTSAVFELSISSAIINLAI